MKYACGYCGSILMGLSARGHCPNCGGPNPEEIEPEVIERVVRQYVYVQPTSTRPAHYAPPKLSVVQNAYDKFGYNAVTAVLIIVVIAVVASFVYWISYRISPTRATDESMQQSIPTPAPTMEAIAQFDPWENEVWLTATEARALREMPNVVNLAYLENGQALYSPDKSYSLARQWETTRPLGVTELLVTGTAVQLEAYGYTYGLNVYQPFVLSSQPTAVFIVDADGAVWQSDLEELTPKTINEVVSGLEIEISPNPNLSFTY